jgi:hypothetical protein
MVFRVSKFWNSLYVAKRARLKGAFPKATGLRFDADWHSLTTSVKGSGGVVLPLEQVRELQVGYLPDASSWLGDYATEFRWSLKVTADQDYHFFLREEDDARHLGDVVASLLAARGRTLPRVRAGMLLSDLTPRQATDLVPGRVSARSQPGPSPDLVAAAPGAARHGAPAVRLGAEDRRAGHQVTSPCRSASWRERRAG